MNTASDEIRASRITISLTKSEYAGLQRLARLLKEPMSRVVSDLVSQAMPTFHQISDVVEAASDAERKVSRAVQASAAVSEAKLLRVANSLSAELAGYAAQLRSVANSVEVSDSRGEAEGAPDSATSAGRRHRRSAPGEATEKRGRGADKASSS